MALPKFFLSFFLSFFWENKEKIEKGYEKDDDDEFFFFGFDAITGRMAFSFSESFGEVGC